MQPTHHWAKRNGGSASVLALLCAVLLWGCTTTTPPVQLPKDPATRLQEKLDELAENGGRTPVPPKNL
ncbi:MAG: hypothetical protein FJ143_10140, partial [Deltaproteobacteria bacterium]|nr:hypothetical protein [Deltaproteobacteria bacterium]